MIDLYCLNLIMLRKLLINFLKIIIAHYQNINVYKYTMLKNKGEGILQLKYSRIIENLMYVMNCIGLNIAYSINKLSGFTNNPGLHD
jgi:hypothetical protein